MKRLLANNDPEAPIRLRRALDAVPSRDRDGFLDAIFGVDPFVPDEAALPQGCVPYIPCAVDVVLQAVDAVPITERDVFVDIGSGIGRAAILVQLLTGAEAVGIEIQPALVGRARGLAASLRAARFSCIEGDAAELGACLNRGTVFFLYCPFSGARLERVFDMLADIARARRICVCCVQLPVIERAWLELVSPAAHELLIYRSRSAGNTRS